MEPRIVCEEKAKNNSSPHLLLRRLAGEVFDNRLNGKENESSGGNSGRAGVLMAFNAEAEDSNNDELSRLLLRRLRFRFPSRLLEGAAQEELDLRVQAAQVVVRPALDRLQQCSVDTKQEGFAFCHEGLTGKSYLC